MVRSHDSGVFCPLTSPCADCRLVEYDAVFIDSTKVSKEPELESIRLLRNVDILHIYQLHGVTSQETVILLFALQR